MAVVQTLLALLSRQLGRLLNTAFGWATTLLFGKVPQKRQIFLSGVSAASVLWLVVVIGIISPTVATFLLAFVPLPEFVDDNMVRWIMLGLAAGIPLIVGIISQFLLDPAERPRGFIAKAQAVLKGYPYTMGLAITLLMMLVVAPLLKMRDIFRRWSSTHIPVVVEPDQYQAMVDQLQTVLGQYGMSTERARATWLLRWPTRVFMLFVGGAIDDLVAQDLVVLRAKHGELMLHPSDLVVSGQEQFVSRAHALVTEYLSFSPAYLTWTKEAQEIEDRLEAIFHAVQEDEISQQDALRAVGRIQRKLADQQLSYEEWEILFRERILLERKILLRELDVDDEVPIEELPVSSSALSGATGTALKVAAVVASAVTMAVTKRRSRQQFEESVRQAVAEQPELLTLLVD